MPRVIRARECRAMLGISNGAFYARQSPVSAYFDPNFPTRVRLGQRAVGYLLTDIERYIENLKR